MNDAEVVRLRRLRECALRSRAIARAMAANPHTRNDPLLVGGVGSGWRIARAVSGKLKAHPNSPRCAMPGCATIGGSVGYRILNSWRCRLLSA